MKRIGQLKYPQNYILSRPGQGALVLTVFIFLFTLLYKPLQVHPSQHFGLALTLAAYSLAAGLAAFLFILLLRQIPWFHKSEEWTLLKEILSIFILLTAMGIAVYFLAFLLEPPASRWNMETFLNSVFSTWIVGLLPFATFSLMHIQYLGQDAVDRTAEASPGPQAPEIHIRSKLKREKLSFFPQQLLYVEADGNYVQFHLQHKEEVKRHTIRNSISAVEMQLQEYPWLMRTHRAFIVNTRKVEGRKGNSAGYRLRLPGVQTEIPVSRNRTAKYDRLRKKYT